MTAEQVLLLLIPVAYLAGSIPFGLLVGLSRGVDVRKGGSGNIGATNVARLLGTRYFFLVFVLDLLKGLVPVAVAGMLLRGQEPGWQGYALWLLVGFAAIAGHMFSIFLKFRGGKGVATSAGVLLGVWPYFTLPALAGIAVWIVCFKLTRYVSLGSILGAGTFPLWYLLFGLARGWDVSGAQLPLMVFAVLMALLVVVRHRSNISRLRAGTEPKFARQKPAG
jgi:acyl phosphate:glycerol-3-phosphate acyltransferase